MDTKATLNGAMPWGSSSASPVPRLPGPSPPQLRHAAALRFVSSWSGSPNAGQLLSVQAFARGSKAWGAQQGYTCLTIP